jgi:hypothetical protein
MDLCTPPKLGGETFLSLIEKVIQINQRIFPHLDQEGWIPAKNEQEDGVVELWFCLSFHIMEIENFRELTMTTKDNCLCPIIAPGFFHGLKEYSFQYV